MREAFDALPESERRQRAQIGLIGMAVVYGGAACIAGGCQALAALAMPVSIKVGGVLIKAGTAASTRMAGREILKAARGTLAGLARGEGRAFAGNGTKVALREAENLAKQFGGKAGDYQAVSSKVIAEASNGAKVEVHAFRNAETGQIYSPKIKVQGGQ
jgi:hypothetical protein